MVGAGIGWCIIILVIYLKAIHLSKWLANQYLDMELSLKLWTLFICIMFIIHFSFFNFLLGGHEPGPLQGVHGLSPTKWGIHQRAKKVMSNSPGLVDFAIGLVNSVFNLPNGQVMFFEQFESQKNCEINSARIHLKEGCRPYLFLCILLNDVWNFLLRETSRLVA